MFTIPTLPENVLLVAITGGPGAGKSDFIKMLKDQYPESVVIVSEVARGLMKQGLFRPPVYEGVVVPELRDPLQLAIAHVQLNAELQWAHWAARRFPGKLIILACDRGFFDAPAYLPGGVDELSDILGIKFGPLYERYHMVIHFQSAAFVLTDAEWQSMMDGQRFESREQAMGLCPRFGEVWAPMGDRYYFVEAQAHDVLGKMNRGLQIFKAFAERSGIVLPK